MGFECPCGHVSENMDQLHEHYLECTYDIPCRNGCGAVFPAWKYREIEMDHIRFDCPEVEIMCPVNYRYDCKCNFYCKRGEMQAHTSDPTVMAKHEALKLEWKLKSAPEEVEIDPSKPPSLFNFDE